MAWDLSVFLSTPSVGRATVSQNQIHRAIRFLSTPSVGRATLVPGKGQVRDLISIHALRGEGDVWAVVHPPH